MMIGMMLGKVMIDTGAVIGCCNARFHVGHGVCIGAAASFACFCFGPNLLYSPRKH